MLRVVTADDASPDELTRLAGSPDHQGMVAEVEPYPYADPDELLEQDDALIVALDQVQDPHNLGAVCRSAEAAGATGVVIPDRRARRRSPRPSARRQRERLSTCGLRRSGTWPTGSSVPRSATACGLRRGGGGAERYTAADLSGPVVLVLGSEGKGLRPRVASACDVLVSIPLAGETASLNVSAAAAVLLFEAVRQRAS